MTGLLLAVSFLLVALNGFFVAAEFSLVRAKASHIEDSASEGSKRSARVLQEMREIDSYLSACQLGITLASIGLGFAGEPALGHVFKPVFGSILGEGAAAALSITAAFALITVLHIVIGELAPKSIAIASPEPVARWVSGPLHVFKRLFDPLIFLLNGAANALVGLFGVTPAREMHLATSGEDLRKIVAHARSSHTLDAGEAHMLSGVFELHESEARQVMTPMPAVVTVDVEDNVEIALRRCNSSGHTRLPVTEDGSSDKIRGVVHINALVKLLLNEGSDATIERSVKPAIVVPETKPLDDLLADLQRERMSMAVVVDEYGRTAGIVTVEDIVEEVVGEIDDETDSAMAPIRQLSNGDWYVRGHVPVADLEDHGLKLPVDSDAYNSVGGYVFGELGRLPQRGDQVRANGYLIRVESVRENRIEAVRIRESAAPAADTGQLSLETGAQPATVRPDDSPAGLADTRPAGGDKPGGDTNAAAGSADY